MLGSLLAIEVGTAPVGLAARLWGAICRPRHGVGAIASSMSATARARRRGSWHARTIVQIDEQKVLVARLDAHKLAASGALRGQFFSSSYGRRNQMRRFQFV